MKSEIPIRRAARPSRYVLAVAAAILSGGCQPSLPPSKPLSQLNPQETSGYQIYRANCASCHYADSLRGYHGPGLQGLYKRPYLPSGAPANDDRVTSAILHGRGMMPAFGDRLDEQQLADLIAYLHSL